jgi:hypothetical protein
MRRVFHPATFGLLLACAWWACACSSQAPEPRAGAGAADGSTVGCSVGDGDAYTAGLRKQGAAGVLDFTLLSSTPAPPALDDNRFVVRVSDAQNNVAVGELSVALDMPQHGHPSPKQPDIRFDAQREAFLLEPVRLFMVGLWRITFSFEGSSSGVPLTDSAAFEFCID